MTDNLTGSGHRNQPRYLAGGGDADSDQQEMPGQSIYDGMFSLNHVSGSSFLSNMAGGIAGSGVQLAEKAVELINPAAGAAWEAAKKASQQFSNVSSTLGKMLRIRGRLPNLDPHVYGDEGPLSTVKTGHLFNFADPLKSTVFNNYVFPQVAQQLGLTTNNSSSGNNSNGNENSGDGDSENYQPNGDPAAPVDSGAPNIGQLAETVWKNAVRDVTTFTTPKLTVPTGRFGTEEKVDNSFNITTEWPVVDPLVLRNRDSDAAMIFLPTRG